MKKIDDMKEKKILEMEQKRKYENEINYNKQIMKERLDKILQSNKNYTKEEYTCVKNEAKKFSNRKDNNNNIIEWIIEGEFVCYFLDKEIKNEIEEEER